MSGSLSDSEAGRGCHFRQRCRDVKAPECGDGSSLGARPTY